MASQSRSARSVIIRAFNKLLLSRRQTRPKIADVLAEAGVARSTFYEHFDGRDSLLLEAMLGPLSFIADTAAGNGDKEALIAILEHFKAYRREAAELFSGPLVPRIVRALAKLIAERLPSSADRGNAALHLADMQIGFIRLWVTGETAYAPNALADLMIACARAQRPAFEVPAEHRP
jgi:AcrR family transcriptional regulator